jgi:hypothetical protein
MGRTRKSVVLAVMVGLATICSTQTQPVTFVTTANAHACLHAVLQRYSHFRSRHLDPNDSAMMLRDELAKTTTPNGSIIVAYILGLELLLAGVAAAACLLILALAGAVAKLQKRPLSHAAPIMSPVLASHV